MSKTPPRVSVLMLTYNQERYVEQAVRSALAQQADFGYEIVVGEDCSTDHTRDLLRRLDGRHPGRLRLLFRDANLGMMRNFMETYAACEGEYVALLDGDDYWTATDKLGKQVAALDAHPEWSLCFHRALVRDEANERADSLYPEDGFPEVSGIRELLQRNFIHTASIVLRRNCLPELPPWFRECPIGDWPLTLLLASSGDIGYLPEVMSAYRIHAGGVFSTRAPAGQWKAVSRMYSLIDRHFGGRFMDEIEASRGRHEDWLYEQIQDLKDALRDSEIALAAARERLREDEARLKEYEKQVAGYERALARRLARGITFPLRWARERWCLLGTNGQVKE